MGKKITTEVRVFLKFLQLSSSYSFVELRLLFVLLVGYAGLLRADELLSVRYKDINIEEDKMTIFIPKRKNDQYQEGHFSNIYKSGKVSCPVSITQELVYLLPDEKDSPFSAIRRIINKKKSKEFHISKGISYST